MDMRSKQTNKKIGCVQNGPGISSGGNQVDNGLLTEKGKQGKRTGWRSELIRAILCILSLKDLRMIFF